MATPAVDPDISVSFCRNVPYEFYLDIPLSVVTENCLHPIKYLRYLAANRQYAVDLEVGKSRSIVSSSTSSTRDATFKD
ncbi:hypothetical protein C8J57DRAFT_1526494 [Mycena rebaudengoi]|nr:hypothetical protein C8J57DRAFT_1526494 [Mycena rebaudengoi]